MKEHKNRWSITSDKFLTEEQVAALLELLTQGRDLAIARGNNAQGIRDYYTLRALLESGLRVFEFCALVNSDFNGHKLTVQHGKGNKRRTVLLTKGTALMLKEWQTVKLKLGLDSSLSGPMFPSRYNRHYTTRGVQKRVKEIFWVLRFSEQLSVHSLRHTYCSMLLASGKVGLATVKENLGHHSIAVTNLYAHAVGDLSGVELYSDGSSYNPVFSELEPPKPMSKAFKPIASFLKK